MLGPTDYDPCPGDGGDVFYVIRQYCCRRGAGRMTVFSEGAEPEPGVPSVAPGKAARLDVGRRDAAGESRRSCTAAGSKAAEAIDAYLSKKAGKAPTPRPDPIGGSRPPRGATVAPRGISEHAAVLLFSKRGGSGPEPPRGWATTTDHDGEEAFGAPGPARAPRQSRRVPFGRDPYLSLEGGVKAVAVEGVRCEVIRGAVPRRRLVHGRLVPHSS